MGAIGHQSEKPSSSGGSPSAGERDRLRRLRAATRRRPTARTCGPGRRARRACRASRSGAARAAPGCVRPRRSRRRRRDRRAGAAGRGSRSSNDESAIRRAWIGSHAASGIEQQAAARIGGEDQPATPPFGQRVAMRGGNREAALGVEGELRDAAKRSPGAAAPPPSAPPPTPPLLLAHRPIHSM